MIEMWLVSQRYMCWKLGGQCVSVKMAETLSGRTLVMGMPSQEWISLALWEWVRSGWRVFISKRVGESGPSLVSGCFA